jgi:hypothetical protein
MCQTLRLACDLILRGKKGERREKGKRRGKREKGKKGRKWAKVKRLWFRTLKRISAL